jgi:hypothetical protein
MICALLPAAEGAQLFSFILCTMYGALLALATPDTRGLDYFLEKEFFYVQHVLLAVLPLVWVARRRFPLLVASDTVTLSWAVFLLIHFVVFLPASLLSGRNVNYMLVPPHGLLRLFGALFRPVMSLMCLGFAWMCHSGEKWEEWGEGGGATRELGCHARELRLR